MRRMLIALAIAAPSLAAPARPIPSAAPQACAADTTRHRFDFWIGDWNVTTKAGVPAGTSSIQSIALGCGLLENWSDLRGGSGKSLNSYDPVSKTWQQYWVGSGGAVTFYGTSEWHGTTITFVTHAPVGPGAPPSLIHLSFTPLADGTVRQLSESSTDGGTTWTTGYDLYYHKRT